MKNEFKVVRILDEYRIIINAGSENGVTENSSFEIHGVIDNVYDPDTRELLGTISGIKAKVFPVEIYEKMSICKNVKIISRSALAEAFQSIQLTFAPEYLNIPQKLNVDKTQISNPEIYEPIRIGDKALFIANRKTSLSERKDTELEEATATEEDPICSPENQSKE